MASQNASKAAKRASLRSSPTAQVKTPQKRGLKLPVPAKKAAAVSAKIKAIPADPACERYHHGDLHEALLKAAKRVAEREGIAGLTLRAVAREAGVSHAAPAHHFGDAAGLLSELAAIGFQKFGATMQEAAQAASDPDDAAQAKAGAYVRFARENPCMFSLMFRAEKLDHSRPVLKEAASRAFANLARSVGERRGEAIDMDRLTVAQAADIARIWSMVHGFAMLRLDGRIQEVLSRLPDGTTEETLLAAMLKSGVPAAS